MSPEQLEEDLTPRAQADLRELVGAGGRTKKKNEKSMLQQCSTDLTEQAKLGKLDAVVGRDEEVRPRKRGAGVASRAERSLSLKLGEFPVSHQLEMTGADKTAPFKNLRACCLGVEILGPTSVFLRGRYALCGYISLLG